MKRYQSALCINKTVKQLSPKIKHDPSQQLIAFCNTVIKGLQRILKQLQEQIQSQAIKQKRKLQALNKDLSIKTDLNQCLLQINARLLKQNEKLKKKLQKQQNFRHKNMGNTQLEIISSKETMCKGINKISLKSVQEQSSRQMTQLGQNSIKSQCEDNFNSRMHTFCDSNLSAEYGSEKSSKDLG